VFDSGGKKVPELSTVAMDGNTIKSYKKGTIGTNERIDNTP
jgi:hypothetical protein